MVDVTDDVTDDEKKKKKKRNIDFHPDYVALANHVRGIVEAIRTLGQGPTQGMNSSAPVILAFVVHLKARFYPSVNFKQSKNQSLVA